MGALWIADEYNSLFLVSLVFVHTGMKREENEVELVKTAFSKLFNGEIDVREIFFEKTTELGVESTVRI